MGARIMNSEAGNTWIANGLGYYLSGRMLWDVDAADEVEGLIDDFLEKSFGNAQEPMRRFYEMIALDYDSPRSNEDLLANMYGYIKEARALTEDPLVLARLDDIALYTRYVELWFRFEKAVGDDTREKAAQDVYRLAYRMQGRMLLSAGATYSYLRGRGINVPEYANPRKQEYIEPWTSNKLFTGEEIEQFIGEGVAAYKKDNMGFQPVSYSEDLVPAAEMLGLPEVSTGDMGSDNSFYSHQKMFTWFWPDNKQLTLDVTGGLIVAYRDRGNVRFKLFSPKEALVEPVDTNRSVPPDGEMYQIVLKSPYDGIHELEWDAGGNRSRVKWPEGHPMTVRSSINDPADLIGNWKLYFYVPKGTKSVGGYASSKNIQVFSGDASEVLDLRNTDRGAGYFNIPVPDGQDGTLWQLQCASVTVRLMTVPPYLARNEKELLLPKEVVEADKSK
jgi:hypothetical protein